MTSSNGFARESKHRHQSEIGDFNHPATSTMIVHKEVLRPSGDDVIPKVEGLFNIAALAALVVWFATSFLTLFMNKYTLSTLKAEPVLFCKF